MLLDFYVCLYCYSQLIKWEFFLVIDGMLELLFFDEQGEFIECIVLSLNSDCFGVEILLNIWYVIVCYVLVMFVEVK